MHPGTTPRDPGEEESVTVGSCFLIKSLCLIRSSHPELFQKLLISLGVMATRPVGSGVPHTSP